MVYQPPLGARDLLPLEVAQQQWIELRLRAVFDRWSYQPIITSTLERLDTLMAGGAVQRGRVLQVLADGEGELGLRPELTASIARAAVTRLAQAPRPLRLGYLANVFRRQRQQESYQAGVELLGVGGVMADVEILLLLTDCLRSLGLVPKGDVAAQALDEAHAAGNAWSAQRGKQQPRCTILVGEAALTRSLLNPFPERLRAKVLEAIAHLDRLGLEQLDLPPQLRHQALQLMDLRGAPAEVLAKLNQFDLSADQRAIAARLQAIMDLVLQRFADRGGPELILDLSLVKTFDYYTGIVFDLACGINGINGVVAQGGRYDQLLGFYHPQGEASPGIGFSFEIEPLVQVLQATGQLPQAPASIDWLVVPREPAAYAAALDHAEQLRRGEGRGEIVVETYLAEDATPEQVRAYGRDRAIGRIAWVRGDLPPEVESLGA